MIPCKQDCNFNRLLSINNSFSINITQFVLNILQYLPVNSADQCRIQFPSLQSTLGNLQPSLLNNNNISK